MKTKPKLLLILAALVFVFASCKPQQTATSTSPLSASLSELTGKVGVKQADEKAFAPASADISLKVNGQVQTGDDGHTRLDLTSGTIIRVAPSSLFTLTSNDEVEGGLATKIKLQFGKIFIILNGGNAEVETPSGVAAVHGSYMKVEVDPETLTVYITCLEGNCSASNEAGSVEFTQGEKTVLFQKDPVTGNWTIPNVEPMTPEDFQEWLDENPEAKKVFNQAMQTLTALAEPTETPAETPTATLETALPAAGNSNACFTTIQPASGSSFGKQGKIVFEWNTQTGAQKYVVTISDIYGNTATLESTETALEKYIEILPNGGDYEWSVTAYNSEGKEICTTASVTFSKEQGEPTAKPTKEPEATEPPAAATQPPYCNPCDYFGSCYDPQNPSCGY